MRKPLRLVKRTARRVQGLARRALYKPKTSTFDTIEPGPDRLLITTPQFGQYSTLDLILRCIASCDEERIRKVWNDNIVFGGAMVGAVDLFDIHVLCGLIKQFQVTQVMECAPNYGWSTTFIQMALPGWGDHRSFDMENYEKTIRRNVARHVPLRN